MVMQNQGRCELLSILKCKPLYLIIALALVGYEFTLHSTAPRWWLLTQKFEDTINWKSEFFFPSWTRLPYNKSRHVNRMKTTSSMLETISNRLRLCPEMKRSVTYIPHWLSFRPVMLLRPDRLACRLCLVWTTAILTPSTLPNDWFGMWYCFNTHVDWTACIT